jgi:hypothetical protein
MTYGKNSVPKSQHDRHIGVCVRKELACRHRRLLSDIHYCYLCFEWIIGKKWNDHCQWHLCSINSKRCGSITSRHTLVRPGYCPFCLGDKGLPAAERLALWTRDHHLWTHVNDDHARTGVWPALCPHPLCDDLITDDHVLWQHLVDKHGLSHSRPGTVSSRKRNRSDEAGFLEWTPEHEPPSSKRSRCATSTISPRLLSTPTSDGCHVDETEHLTDLHSDENPLDEYITEVGESAQLTPTGTCSVDDSFFSEFLRSPSPIYISMGEFSGCSSDTAVDPVTDEALPTPSTELLSGAPDHSFVRADGQSHVTTKPIRIRLRVNPPPKRPQKTNIVLRLKGLKHGKGARERRKKARRSG